MSLLSQLDVCEYNSRLTRSLGFFTIDAGISRPLVVQKLCCVCSKMDAEYNVVEHLNTRKGKSARIKAIERAVQVEFADRFTIWHLLGGAGAAKAG